MAKGISGAPTSTGRSVLAKAKAATPPPPKAKAATTQLKKKTGGKTAPTKAVAVKAGVPKMAPASRKSSAVPAKTPAGKASAKGRAPIAKKAVAATPRAKQPAKRKAAPAPATQKAPSRTQPSRASASRTAAPQKAAGRKAAPPPTPAARSKSVAVKKAAPRRPAVRTAVPTPAPRRGRPAPAPRPAAAAAAVKSTSPQVFTVSHLNEADFKADGLRTYAQYRDLGIAAATAGLCQAHVIRFVPPCTDEVRKRHQHQADLQLIYVLKGWMKNEFEGHGEQMMSTGSCWLQPSGIKHTVLDYSPDCEVLEIIVPADFKTEEPA